MTEQHNFSEVSIEELRKRLASAEYMLGVRHSLRKPSPEEEAKGIGTDGPFGMVREPVSKADLKRRQELVDALKAELDRREFRTESS